MDSKDVVVMLLLFSLSGWCSAQSTDCNPYDIDPTVLAEANIFPSESIMDILQVASVDQLRAHIDEMVMSNKTLFEIRDKITISKDEAAELDGTTLNNPVDPADSADATAKLSYDMEKLYRPVCPHRWMYIRYWQWVFLFPGQKKYCFSICSFWVTSCIYRYCHVHKYWDYWHFYFRCAPEYRSVFMPMICISENVWSIEYRLQRIPRGCCCQRYWPWKYAAQSCPKLMA